jgi:hypothetical protein
MDEASHPLKINMPEPDNKVTFQTRSGTLTIPCHFTTFQTAASSSIAAVESASSAEDKNKKRINRKHRPQEDVSFHTSRSPGNKNTAQDFAGIGSMIWDEKKGRGKTQETCKTGCVGGHPACCHI